MFYVGNIGNIVSLISNSYSRKINKLCKDNSNKEDYKDAYENNNTIVDKRKSINSIYFNYNCPNDDVNNKNDFNDKSDFNNSKMLFNGSFISNNMQGFGNMTNYNFIRTFPGKVLYDMFSNEDNNEKNLNDLIKKNPINNNNSNNKRMSKENFMRRPSTTFGGAGNCNFKNIKLNNYVKDTNQILKNFQPTKEKDNLFNLSPNFLLNNLNYNKFYRNSFISQNTYNDIFPEIKIITSYPDVMSFRYQNNYHDFLLICCRAIFEKLTHDKICKGIYETMKKCIRKNRSFEMFLGCVVKDIIKRCISLGVTSNLSCLFICFDPIKQLYLKQDINSIKNILVSFYLNATLTNKNKFELYDNFLTFDFIDIDKANDYNLFLSKEIEKMKKIKNHLSTNIIDTSAINARPSDEDINYKNEYKYKKKSRCLPKKCNCLTY
jgi:hypothetical protein